MPNPLSTDDLFASAAQTVLDTFGSRTASGELDREAVVIELADERVVKSRANLGKEEVEYVQSGSDLVKSTTRTAMILVRDVPEIEGVPLQAKVWAEGKRYAVADTGSSRDDSILVLALRRDPTAKHAPMQGG